MPTTSPARVAAALGVVLTSVICIVREPACRPCDAMAPGAASRVERIVNQHRPSRQEAAALAPTADGGVAIVWQSRHQGRSAASVHLRRFGADGAPLGDEQPLGSATEQPSAAPVVAAGREPLAAWTRFAGDARCDVQAAAGVELAGAAGDQTEPVVAALGDGFAAAWLDNKVGGQHEQAFVRALAADGRPTGAAARLDDASGETPRPVALAAAGTQGIAVWAAIGADGQPRGIRARRLDAGAQPLAGSVLLVASAGAIEPSVAADPAGFAIAWMQRDAAGDRYDVRLACFDWDCTPLGAPVVVAAADGVTQTAARVAIATDGRIACAWNRGERDAGGRDLHVRMFARDGRPLDAAFVATAAREGDQALSEAPHRPALAFTPAGALAIAWSGELPGGTGEDVGLTLLLPAGHPVAAVTPDAWPAAPRQEGVAAITSISETAVPHDPPIRGGVPSSLPNGGDLNPVGFNDPGFLGITFQGLTPPDPHLAAGPEHVVGIVNGGLGIWRKDGTQTFFQKIDGSGGFWAAIGGTGFVFDPEVIFDPHTDRFMAMACERNAGSYFLLAVSDDHDPNGVWHKYRFNVSAAAGANDIDSPNLAVDRDAVYLSADFFTGGQKYLVYMVAKGPLLSGQTPPAPKWILFTGSQSYGMPVVYSGAPAMYLIEHFEAASNTVVGLRAIRDPLGTPTVTPPPTQMPLLLPVPAYERPTSVPQLGTSGRITTFDSRFWSCVWRNGSLWATHHHGSSQVRARWYEIQTNNWPLSGTPTLRQSGDVNPGPGIHTFFNAISVDAYGNALMCFARSATNEFISIGRAFRNAADPLGTMQPMAIVKANTLTATTSRWGDYSGVWVDPTDNATFWYHHEYSPTASTWNTWIAYRRVQEPSLVCDVQALPAATGGTARFTLSNPIRPGDPYLLLGTLSGTSPGFLLPGPPSYIRVPLNYDALTTLVLGGLSNPVFTRFHGNLDANGRATAQLNCPPVPFLLGQTAHFAWLHYAPTANFASNAVGIRFQ